MTAPAPCGQGVLFRCRRGHTVALRVVPTLGEAVAAALATLLGLPGSLFARCRQYDPGGAAGPCGLALTAALYGYDAVALDLDDADADAEA